MRLLRPRPLRPDRPQPLADGPPDAPASASPDPNPEDARASGDRTPEPAGDSGENGRTEGDPDGERLSGRLSDDRDVLAERLGWKESFDILFYDFDLAGRDALLITVDGFFKDDILLRITQFLLSAGEAKGVERSLTRLREAGVAYVENEMARTFEEVSEAVLAGQAALLLDGRPGAVLIDERTYPARRPSEPTLEKLIRGPKDGLVETIIFNTALIRRRLRDPNLRVELFNVGARSKQDIALLYLKDVANADLVATVRARLEDIRIDALPMAEKVVEEFLIPAKRWWNPFPTVRYSERPDVVAIHLLEGHVAVITDTSPAVMLLPVTFFHHLEAPQEFHEEPLTGAFIRWLRMAGVLVAWFGPPLWLALALSHDLLPPSFNVIGPKEPGIVPLGLQFLVAELSANLVWVALIHTPDALATSLGLIGALLIGQAAVEVGLFTWEVLLYTSAAFIGTFASPSIELGNAIRLMRTLLLVITSVARLPGFVIGAILTVLLMISTRSFGVRYLYPLWPLDWHALGNVLLRRPVPSRVVRPAFLRTKEDRLRPPHRGRHAGKS